MKRTHEGEEHGEPSAKLRRVPKDDRLSKLSDELLVRILSFTPMESLLVCQRVSKKLCRLAVDPELWKAAYYRKFVLPKALRIPGIKDLGAPGRLHYSSKLCEWLDEGHLIKDEVKTNWKQQFRLRYNWAHGQCAVTEIVVADRPPDAPLLVMMSKNTVYTVDSISGLRAWSPKDGWELLATTRVFNETDSPRLPASMAIDAIERDSRFERVVVGFEDGSFSIYVLRRDHKRFDSLFTNPPSINGPLAALAFSSPYLLTLTEDHLLSLYAFENTLDASSAMESPRLLYSIQSRSARPPMSLSFRGTAASMTAAIAYSLPDHLFGWTVGLHELRLSYKGELLDSRSATAADNLSSNVSAHQSVSSLINTPSRSKPTSMSYSHPYLLVAHPDGTLSFYLVRSTSSALSISSGECLWGHTSSISGAYIGRRGKAVSVSRLGDEIRLWDLEGGMASSATRERLRNGELSVRVQPSRANNDVIAEAGQISELRLALIRGRAFDDTTISRGWVGFDEQNLIILREKKEGTQVLAVYDFC